MPTPIRVLIVEDRPGDAELMAYELERAGFDPAWQRVETEADYLAQLQSAPDIILADHTLPNFGAPRALDLLKERGLNIPFIVVTGSISEEVAVERIKQGAADYLLKDRLTRLGQAVEHALNEKRLQEEKRAAQEAIMRLAAIVESSDDAIVGTTLDGIVVTWNPAAERLYGYSTDEIKGRPISVIVPRDRLYEVSESLERLKSGETIPHCDTVRTRKDGQQLHISLAVSPIKDLKGNIVGTSAIARDITERKRAEEVLSQISLEGTKQQRSRAARDLGTILALGVLVFTLSEYFEAFPRVSAWVLKYQHILIDELIVTLVFLAFAFAVFSYRRWKEAKAEVSGRKQAEEALRRLHGELEIRVQERTSDLAKSNESLRAEIAQRKRAQEEAQRNLERIRALHEIDLAITSTLDLDIALNTLLEKIDLFLPYATATVRLFNKKGNLLEPVACRNLDEKEWKTEQWKAGRGSANIVFETRAPLMIRNCYTDPRVKDPAFFRKHRLVSYLGVPLIAKDEILGVLSFYTKEEHEFTNEETELLTTLAGQAAIAIYNAQLYEQTKKQAEELARAIKVKDEFLSVMSHELRTPLNVVVGYTGMIKDGLLGEINPRQQEAMEKVINRANDQLALVNNILYATVLETEKINVESQVVVLGDFLNQLKSAYDTPLHKELTLNWECSSPLSVIHTDGAKLKHIVQNLINNALKFTSKGSVTISAGIVEGKRQEAEGSLQRAESSEQRTDDSAEILPTADRLLPTGEGRWLEIKVADTGVGIPEDHLSAIFDKFRQVDSSETRLFGGVGMGLYIVKQFTELLGGTVEVESEVGKGSTFTVTIPCQT